METLSRRSHCLLPDVGMEMVDPVDISANVVVVSSTPSAVPRPQRATSAERLAKRLGLKLIAADELTIRRRRCGQGFAYFGPDGKRIVDRAEIRRLKSLAVPPAYEDVLCADAPDAHLQAIGRDAAGRLQYRYHREWEKVREARKSHRLARLVDALPRIRRNVAQHLATLEPTRELALSAVIELVARSAIRAGYETYARQRGTRGATTLLKSNVIIAGDTVTLSFRAKGGLDVEKSFPAPRLGAAIEVLRRLPGRRLFQYRAADGTCRKVTPADVNAFLQSLAGAKISLKDFRTLCASASALETLARTLPATTERQRRKQVLEAVRMAAVELHNTPTICRKSYVHEAVVSAFENGVLDRFTATFGGRRSQKKREQALAAILASAGA
jgi:DNA topoisomerase I